MVRDKLTLTGLTCILWKAFNSVKGGCLESETNSQSHRSQTSKTLEVLVFRSLTTTLCTMDYKIAVGIFIIFVIVGCTFFQIRVNGIDISQDKLKQVKKNEEDHELNLLHRVTKDYKLIREIVPAENYTTPLTITFDIAYSQLVDLDSKDQILTSYIWVRQFWNNTRLSWNPAEYGGIKSLHIDPKLSWVPDIVLYNNINENTIGEMFKFDTKVIIRYDGYIEWFAPTLIKSICKIDITYFPFDQQTCKLVFGSWTFTSQFLLLEVKGNKPDLSKYTPNGEWDLIKVTRKKNVVKYTCCVHPYIDITYTLHIKRRPMFYVQNLIIPCILLATLSVLSFSLPPGSGERIALVITLLLGLTVYMLIFTENIPKTSEVVPVINKFFVAVLFEVALCLLATSITLQFYHYHDPEKEIPSWLRFLIFSCLAKILRMKMKKATPNELIMFSHSKRDRLSVTPLLSISRSHKCRICYTTQGSECKSTSCSTSSLLLDRLDGIQYKLDGLYRATSEKVALKTFKEQWHFAAMVLDRFFYIVSATIIFISLASFYITIPV